MILSNRMTRKADVTFKYPKELEIYYQTPEGEFWKVFVNIEGYEEYGPTPEVGAPEGYTIPSFSIDKIVRETEQADVEMKPEETERQTNNEHLMNELNEKVLEHLSS